MNTLEGKTALITGGSSGIGRETALLMASEGASIIVADVNEAGGKETVALIEKDGGKALYITCNVADAGAVKKTVEEGAAHFGSLDIAVNNAGIGGPFAPTTHYSHSDWDKVIAINQSGVFYCMQEELKIMQAQKSGVIVNISSIAGIRSMPNSIAYVASKHAVIGMTKTAALECARHNVRVNAVCPVFTRSPLFDSMFTIDPSYEEKLRKSIPLHRYGQPADIANAIHWLCKEESSFVTGLCLPIDGGMTAK